MSDRILLDTNAILNSTFIPESWSRLAIDTALDAKASICIGTATTQEALNTALRMAHEMRKRTDPRPLIEAHIRTVRAMHVVVSSDTRVPREIPRNDALVYREAQTSGAALLTSDAALWLACRQLKPPAILPLELIRRYNGVALSNTIFGVLPTRDSGSIFLRLYPGSWARPHVCERFTAMHFPGDAVWLYYDAGKRKWIAELAGYKPLEVAAEVAEGELQTVGLSWRLGEQVVLRVTVAEHPAVVAMGKPLPDDVEGRVQIQDS